ncbi:hypothetical protein H5410_064375 [Solanum commersonii]|uniref:Uncharacterized protein n=1 Tax=Solanum commersonii TaxID=4109 RepID=A0A9J5VZT7_SOLCO|nr:hypothetical protein H5410_064375 [Solanum commersonii]
MRGMATWAIRSSFTPEESTQIWLKKWLGDKGIIYGMGSRSDLCQSELQNLHVHWQRLRQKKLLNQTIEQIKEQALNLARRPTASHSSKGGQ